MENQHDILAPIRRLPIEIKRDLHTLIVDRNGTTEDAFMRTEHFMGHVQPGQTYLLQWDGMVPNDAVEVSPLPQPTQPPFTRLTGTWISDVDLTIEDANILGGNGRYLLNEDETELAIVEAETTAENLAFYDCRLVPIGDALRFEANGPLPITATTVGQSYTVDYLLDAKHGGGEYLEVHDRPHFHMPLDNDATGHLFIGKQEQDGSRIISAFKIPLGYGILMAPWVIHADSHLVGRYMVIYSATKNFSTVIIRKASGELAQITTQQTPH